MKSGSGLEDCFTRRKCPLWCEKFRLFAAINFNRIVASCSQFVHDYKATFRYYRFIEVYIGAKLNLRGFL